MANHSSILALRIPGTVWKSKKIWHPKMRTSGQKVSNMLLGKRRGQLHYRKNEAPRPKWKWCLIVDVSGGENKVWCCKGQYCIGIWNVKSMNQHKLDVFKQEMAGLNMGIFSDSKITMKGDYSNEIKRHLFLGRKAMTNLDSILKSRDITLPKVHIVKALIFLRVMYNLHWTIKQDEH